MPFEAVADLERDRMALAAAFALGRQVDLDVALVGLIAQIVVAHQPVEVEGRGGAGIGLERGDLGNRGDPVDRLLQHPVGLLDRRALGQIGDDLQVGLVVEGQELDRDVLGIEQAERADGEDADDRQEGPGAPLGGEHRAGDRHVGAAERTPVAVMLLVRRRAALPEAHHQPRRQHHRDEEREQHRGRGIGRDRAHIGAHQARDEEHRQQRRDHRQGGDDGRVADLGHGLDRRLAVRAPVIHAPVAGDVLDDDDGVVDQNADREDEREQADAVERVAHQARGEERQQDRRRDDDGDHDGFAPADREGDQENDRHRGEAKVEEQFVGLLVGGLAVVAGDLHVHIFGEDASAQVLELLDDVLGDDHGVGAGALGDGQRHRRRALDRAVGLAHLGDARLLRLGGKRHIGDVAHIDRAAVARGDEDVADLGQRLQRLPGDQRHLAVGIADRGGLEGAVGALDLAGELLQRDAEQRQFLRVGLDADLLGLVADDVGEPDIGQLGDLDLKLARQPREAVGRPVRRRAGLGRERDGDDGDVVDAAADDQRFGNADRDAVHIGPHLLVHAQDRRIGIGADLEARGHHGAVVGGLRIDVLDAVDALDDRLQRLGDELDRVLGLEAVGADMDVDHRHRDLRLFLARQGDQRDDAEHQRRQQEERRQRRTDEGAGQAPRDTELHGTSTLSPGCRPVRISVISTPSRSKVWPMMTATSTGSSVPPARRT